MDGHYLLHFFLWGEDMSEKIDRRQARTKQVLHKALMELIEEKGVDGVTVTDVAKRADVNRGTFYLHYRDVPDMLEQIKNEVFSQIQSCIVPMDPREMTDYADKDEPYPKMVNIFEEIARHAEFLKVMFGPNGDLSYALRFRQFLTTNIINKLNFMEQPNGKMLVPRDYVVAYMSSANFGMVMHWLESGMKKTPYEIAMMMTQIVNHGPLVSSGLRDRPGKKD